MRTRLLGITLLLLASPLIGQTAVDEHIEAVGGASALAALKSMERSARASVMTPAGTFQGSYREVYDLVGDRGATNLRSEFFVVRNGWSGDAGWRDHSLEGFSEMEPGALGLAKMSASPSLIASVVRQWKDQIKDVVVFLAVSVDCATIVINIRAGRYGLR